MYIEENLSDRSGPGISQWLAVADMVTKFSSPEGVLDFFTCKKKKKKLHGLSP
jgi:hypothetical protein